MDRRQQAEEKKKVFSQRYVYLLRCSDGSLYCGISADPEARLKQHNYGVGAKYTRSRRPCRLVYTEGPYEYGHALSREAAVKKMTKAQKESLLDSTKSQC